MTTQQFVLPVCLALGLLPLAARAGDEIQRAQMLSLQMKYTEALQIAEQLLRNPATSPEEVRGAYEIQAMCLASLGKAKPASEAFQRLLALDPAFDLSPAVSPKIRAMFDKARKDSRGLAPLRLLHAPPRPGASLAGTELAVSLEANTLGLVRGIRLVYSAPGGAPQQVVRPLDKSGQVGFKMAATLALPEIHYYFEALNEGQAPLVRSGSPAEPFTLQVAPPAMAETSPVRKPEGLAEPAPEGDVALAAQDEEVDESGAWYTSWWFWTVVGVVVAGGVAAGVAVGVTQGGDDGTFQYDLVIR